MTAALLACLVIASSDGVDRDPDFLAPFLGRTLVDAEDLARDAADPLPADAQVRESGQPPLAAPFWVALIPNLSVEVVRRQVRQLSGADRLGISSGTVLIVEATFGLEGDDHRGPEERQRAGSGFRLALSSRLNVAETAAEIAPGLPTIAEIQRASEEAALVRLSDLEGWRGRARASAWLPELGVSYQRNVGEIDTLGIQSNLGVDSHNIEDVARYGVRATWQLGQLVFSREEVAAAKAALEVQRDRQELVAHVTELYFEWLKKRAKLGIAGRAAGATTEPSRIDELESLALAELQAKIDALTDGFFSRRLRAGGEP